MMAVQFSTNSEDVIQRNIDASSIATNIADWRDFFEVDRCCEWISTGEYTRVALQFPDVHLPRAAAVANQITQITHSQIFILADTSYGSCCVDEVAGEHYDADAIIHFGHSCLSPSGRLPVLYIFGKASIDVSGACDVITTKLGQCTKLLVIFSVEYYHARDELYRILSQHVPQLAIPEIILPTQEAVTDPTVESTRNCTDDLSALRRKVTLPDGESIEDYIILYVGQPSMFFTNMMLTCKNNTFYSYDSVQNICKAENINVNKVLMRRYYLVEKVKDARIVGILIATLSVCKYLDIVNRMKSLLAHAGKKFYVFSVGKINVPKLANFVDVDVFVLVSCAESVILESGEYFCPIVTPYEVELACDTHREWRGDIVLDYSQLLPGGSSYREVDWSEKVEQMDVSLISGSIRRLGVGDADTDTDGTIATRDPMAMVAVSGDRLGSKSWQGLEPELGQTPVTKAVQGRKGIAIQYEEEPAT